MIPLFMRLAQLWATIMPWITSKNWGAIAAEFMQVEQDFKGGDYTKGFNDLIDLLKNLMPDAPPALLDDHKI
jgi:hypothetical protein